MSYTVKQLNEFSYWLKGLKDGLTKQRLNKRLRKAQLGNLGDGRRRGIRDAPDRAGECTTPSVARY